MVVHIHALLSFSSAQSIYLKKFFQVMYILAIDPFFLEGSNFTLEAKVCTLGFLKKKQTLWVSYHLMSNEIPLTEY